MKQKLKQVFSAAIVVVFALIAMASPYRLRDYCNPLDVVVKKDFNITVTFLDKLSNEPLELFNFNIYIRFHYFNIEETDPCLGSIKGDYANDMTIQKAGDWNGNYVIEGLGTTEYRHEDEYLGITIEPRSGLGFARTYRITKLKFTSPEDIHLYFYALRNDQL